MTDKPTKVADTTYVCEVPKELGAVTKLEVRKGKVIARTESGQTMIVPVATQKEPARR